MKWSCARGFHLSDQKRNYLLSDDWIAVGLCSLAERESLLSLVMTFDQRTHLMEAQKPLKYLWEHLTSAGKDLEIQTRENDLHKVWLVWVEILYCQHSRRATVYSLVHGWILTSLLRRGRVGSLFVRHA